MFYTVFIVLLLIIAGLVLYLATLNGSYNIRCSQLINSNIDTVFNKIIDFKSWPEWSPWIIHEPDTQLEYSKNYNEENGFYTWNAKYIGAGKLTHLKFDRPHLITQKLEFTRPFKSICDVGFEFLEKNGQTEITWVMNGKMPFLFRFMTEKTKQMISKDYDFGLAMLNGLLDPESEHPVVKFEGKTTLEPMYSLCESFSGSLQEMEETMKQSFPKLMSYAEQNGQITGAPYTAYHKVNLKSMHFVCDMAVPVAEGIESSKYHLQTLGSGRFYKATLKGNYKFLELAWYSAIGHVQMFKLKYDKSRATLEVYENDPEKIENTNDILTTLYIPIK